MRALGPALAVSVFLGVGVLAAGETGTASGGWARGVEAARVTGQVRANYFRSSKSLDDERDFIGLTTQLKARPEFSSRVGAKFEARFTNSALGEGQPTRGTLLEGYVAVHFSHADLRLGRQIVAWGRADGINPTDNLSPRDYVVLLPFEDDQRFGTTGARLDVVLPADFTLSVFASPWFEPAKIPLPPGAVARHLKPGPSLTNTAAGVRLDRTGAGVDWSLSYFHGFSLVPSLRLAAAGGVEVRHDRIDVLGADFARNWGRFGFRGEVAYVTTRDRSGADPERRNPQVFLVLGVDRTFFAQLNVNVQYFRRDVQRYHDPANLAEADRRGVAVLQAILHGEREPSSDGVSFRVGNKWFNDTLEAEVFGVLNLADRDRFVRASMTYAFTDHWKGTLGLDAFSGPGDTQFGLQRRNRGAFAEMKFAF